MQTFTNPPYASSQHIIKKVLTLHVKIVYCLRNFQWTSIQKETLDLLLFTDIIMLKGVTV